MAKIHARFGPSRLDSLSGCIRFRYKERTDDSAGEGTELHQACETGNTAGLGEEQRMSVEIARGYADSLLASDGGPDKWIVMREVKLELGDLTYGHADFVAIHKELPRAAVLDYKFTRIESNHAFQVRTYGAALVSMLASKPEGEAVKFTFEDQTTAPMQIGARRLELITTHVCAPRLHEPYEATYDAQRLLSEVVQEIEELYARIDDPFLPPTAREDLCPNCARASKCPEMTAVVLHSARRLGLPVPEAFAPDQMVSDRDRAIAQALKGALENWSELVGKHNLAFVKAGGSIPGYKMQTRSTGMKLAEGASAAQAIEALILHGFVTHDDVMEAISLSFSKLAKHKADTTTLTEGECKEEIRNILGQMVNDGSCTFLAKVKRVTDEELMKRITEGTA